MCVFGVSLDCPLSKSNHVSPYCFNHALQNESVAPMNIPIRKENRILP